MNRFIELHNIRWDRNFKASPLSILEKKLDADEHREWMELMCHYTLRPRGDESAIELLEEYLKMKEGNYATSDPRPLDVDREAFMKYKLQLHEQKVKFNETVSKLYDEEVIKWAYALKDYHQECVHISENYYLDEHKRAYKLTGEEIDEEKRIHDE